MKKIYRLPAFVAFLLIIGMTSCDQNRTNRYQDCEDKRSQCAENCKAESDQAKTAWDNCVKDCETKRDRAIEQCAGITDINEKNDCEVKAWEDYGKCLKQCGNNLRDAINNSCMDNCGSDYENCKGEMDNNNM